MRLSQDGSVRLLCSSLLLLVIIIQKMQGAAETDERIPDPLSDNQTESRRRVMRASLENTPVRINADDQKKWKLVCYSAVVLLVITILALIAGLALPQALVPVNEQQWIQGSSLQYCNTHLQLSDKTVICASSNTNFTTSGAFVTNLVPLNQFLVLYLDIIPRYYTNRNQQLNQIVNFSLYSAQRTLKSDQVTANINVTNLITTNNMVLSGTVDEVFKDNQFFIVYMTKLSKDDDYYWELKFSNSSSLTSNTYYLNSQIVNSSFSLFTIFLRVGLFIVSFAVFAKYNQLIFKLPKDRVSVEQRTIQVLSVMTLTFNDQLYFISVIAPNPFSSFLSSFFLWNFVAFLFMIWALFLNRIRSDQPDTDTHLIRVPVSIMGVVFYALILGYSVTYAITQTTDHPVFSFQDINGGPVLAMEIVAFVVFSLGSLYILYLFVYTLKCRPGRLYRHNIFMVISACFFISTVVFFFVGGYNLFSYSASKILFTLCFMNMYSYFLQYLYAPTQNEVNSFKTEKMPLVADIDLLDIPDAPEVIVDISEDSERTDKDSNEKKSLNSDQRNEFKDEKEESLSSRERRKRLRKQRSLNRSRENNDRGETNSRIHEEEHPDDEFH